MNYTYDPIRLQGRDGYASVKSALRTIVSVGGNKEVALHAWSTPPRSDIRKPDGKHYRLFMFEMQIRSNTPRTALARVELTREDTIQLIIHALLQLEVTMEELRDHKEVQL